MSTLTFGRNLRLALVGASLFAGLTPAHAEVVLGDGTTLTGKITVDGNVGQTEMGSTSNNLFHTFSVFNILPAGTSASGLEVPAQESVTFTSPTVGAIPGGTPIAITNVINRVTGGTSAYTLEKFSLIDGALNSSIPGANFWFINPHGVIFGDNAALNISGSFHASTANRIILADGSIFDANPPDSTVLTSSPPQAFGFLNANPAGIEVGSAKGNFFRVGPDQTLSLVGGTIDIGKAGGFGPGYIIAGRVNLVSVASTGTATFDPTKISGPLSADPGPPETREINVDEFAQLGNVNITGGFFGTLGVGSVVDAKEIFVRSGNLVINNALVSPGLFADVFSPLFFPVSNGGQIKIDATRNVTISGTTKQFGRDSGINARAGRTDTITEARDVPDVFVKAGGTLTLSGGGIFSDRLTESTAMPASFGNVMIVADTLDVRPNGEIAVRNLFDGTGGNLTVDAREIILSGKGKTKFTGLTTQSNFHPAFAPTSTDTQERLTTAVGGMLTIKNADTLTMKEGAEITASSFGFGPAGNIMITVGDMFLSRDGATSGTLGSQSELAGNAGSITIEATGRIEIDEARINVTSTGFGDGGSLDITAGQSISISGTDGGLVSLTAPPLTDSLDGFAKKLSSYFEDTFGTSPISTFSELVAAIDAQPGVDLPANAGWFDVLNALNNDPFSVTNVADLTPGKGGEILITTPSLVMNAGTRIDSSTLWDGDAGQITGNNIGSLTLNSGAQIRSRSGGVAVDSGLPSVGVGQGGDVKLTVADSILITGSNSAVSTNTFGDGDGGIIGLTAGNAVTIQNGGSISADSGGELAGETFSGDGLAGNINVTAGDEIFLSNGQITTQTRTANGGNIVLKAPRIVRLENSVISTSVAGAEGEGGDITIEPEFVVLNQSAIIANAFGGPGGNITIVADNFVPSADSVISASSALSTPGTITIESPENNIAGAIAQLPQNIVDVSGLLPERCAARRAGGAQNSFVVAGRGGLPTNPDNYLPSFGAGSVPLKSAGGPPSGTTEAALTSARDIAVAMAAWNCVPGSERRVNVQEVISQLF